ncbi:MAG TPA: wax ester/triacylglycerol synthase domain-containing protein [Acidimicrobiales bacterium]|nr:wax ester/triacylglycerol synthase domain-containing protein [Acidimicrobiales bacterium]
MADPDIVFMRGSDAFSWYMERDPVLRSTIVAVAWLDTAPDWEVLQRRMAAAVEQVPLFRTRPVTPPARLATPRWTLDPEFDLDWHLRRVAAPPPRGPETVLAMAEKAATTAFDPARPLWEFTLVEGLETGGTAFLMKLHHALTDGIGGMQLALLLFDRSAAGSMGGPRPMGFPEPPAYPVGDTRRGAALAASSIGHDLRLVLDVTRQGGRVVPELGHLVRHPVSTTVSILETLASAARIVAPVRRTLSPVMTERGLGRRLGMLDVRLDDLRGAAAAVGGTVNDAFVASVTGGLRRYHEAMGATVEELRVTMPVSLRKPDDPVAGDRITLMRFAVPVGLADPAERVRATGARCRVACSERAIPYSNLIAGTLNLLPQGAVGAMLKCVDFLASDVPGLAFPVYLAGARVTGYYPYSPTIGAALNTTLLTYDGTCCVGVTMDRDAVDDPGLMVDCLRQGFDEVLSLQPGSRPAHIGPGQAPRAASGAGTTRGRVPSGAAAPRTQSTSPARSS